ncbi:DUF3846 domain-containing protein [Streptomyces sp. SPB074]|uniref:DUF3846 domain-containing protein n=1 Tax=Streptomyces sp. (strain SPB074) TaxID=465543 RepID=UPI00017F0E81|nr:DUF3846 domain-containing protein [Streptomyces sp. SPB074]EDY43957.1 conserved hypothetical protein [Streptomyces sp. SPB074]
MNTAVLITPEGRIAEVLLPRTSQERATVYRTLLRCETYGVLARTSRLDMWMDLDGLYSHPVNPLATTLAQRFGRCWQPYRGRVLLTGGTDSVGETLPLSPEQVHAHLTGLFDLLD